MEEKNSLNGYSKGKAYNSKNMLKSMKNINITMKTIDELPETVDWRTQGIVSAVKDQGHCGSCWAFASTATIESHVALNAESGGLLFDLSTEQIAMCAPNPDHCGGVGGCEGSTAELAFEYVTGSNGLYQEYQYPYTSYYGEDFDCSIPSAISTSPVAMIDGYVKLTNNNYLEVMNALAQVGPLSINIDASNWHAYDSGVYSGCEEETLDINHVVVMVGYGTNENGDGYWLVRNSWSPGWGEEGYIKLFRATENTHITDKSSVCKWDVTPTDGVECEGSNEPVLVCGTCGAIYDVSYPLMASAL